MYTRPMPLLPLAVSALICFSPLPQDPPVDHGKAWVGTKAKGVALQDENGKTVDLSKEIGKRPIILVFYRAFW